MSFGEFPSDGLILKLARALGGDPDELMLLAEKIPDAIRQRVLQRPDAFRKFAGLDDKELDSVLEFLDCEARWQGRQYPVNRMGTFS